MIKNYIAISLNGKDITLYADSYYEIYQQVQGDINVYPWAKWAIYSLTNIIQKKEHNGTIEIKS